MSEICAQFHRLISSQATHHFPFDAKKIPQNGIYMLFEVGELGHDGHRIVRVGTHTGIDQLRSRLKQHFINENKDRSIFRKNIGRAILNRNKDPFLEKWNLDLTTRAAKNKYAHLVDFEKQAEVERQVTTCIQNNFYFVVMAIAEKEYRLALEAKMISTVSWCKQCQPSALWLGRFSPKQKIRESGLWLVNQLYKQPLDKMELRELQSILINA